MTHRIYHPGIDAYAEAVNDAQLEHLATLGWQPAPDPADDGPDEVFVETFTGTTSSLGADLVLDPTTDDTDDAPPVDLDPPELGEEA